MEEPISWNTRCGRFSPTHQAKVAKEFTKRFLAPTCLDAFSLQQARKIVPPFNVDFACIDAYLTQYYAHPVTGGNWEQFLQSVKVIQIGPLIEARKIMTGKYCYNPLVGTDSNAGPPAKVEKDPLIGIDPNDVIKECIPIEEKYLSSEDLDKWIDECTLGQCSAPRLNEKSRPMQGGGCDESVGITNREECIDGRIEKITALAKRLRAHLGEYATKVAPAYLSLGIAITDPAVFPILAELKEMCESCT
jgi:hypothetical protein